MGIRRRRGQVGQTGELGGFGSDECGSWGGERGVSGELRVSGLGGRKDDAATHQEREYRRKIRFGREDKFRRCVDSRQSVDTERMNLGVCII